MTCPPLTRLALSLLATLLCVLLAEQSIFVHALYEDQIGKADWYNRGIGEITGAVFLNRKTYAITNAGVLACMDTETGELHWRRIYPKASDGGDSIEMIRTDGKSSVFTLSSTGLVRGWSEKGDMMWSRPVEEGSSIFAVSADVNGDGRADVFTGSERMVTLLSGRNGKVLWSWSGAEDLGISVKTVHLGSSPSATQIVGVDRNSLVVVNVDVSTFSSDDATSSSVKRFSTANIDISSVLSLDIGGARYVVYLARGTDSARLECHLFDLDAGEGSVKPLSEIISGAISPDYIVSQRPASPLASHANSPALRVSVSETREELLTVDPSTRALVRVRGLRCGESCRDVSVAFDARSGAAVASGSWKAAWLVDDASLDDGAPYRMLRTTLDGTGEMTRGGDRRETMWRNEAGLANIRQATFVRRPPSSAGDGQSTHSAEPTFMDRLQMQADVLTSYATGLFSGSPVETDLSFFGFDQIVLARSGSGSIYGVDAINGSILWKTHLSGAQRFVVDRTSATAHVIVRGDDQTSTSVVALSALTGDTLGDAVDLPYDVREFVPLRREADSDLVESSPVFAALLVDADGGVHVYPDTDAARRLAQLQASKMIVFHVNRSTGVARGFGLASPPADDGPVFVADMRWTLQLATTDSERIVSVVTPSSNPVNAAARTLGDHSLLLKYLNEHVVAVTSVNDADFSLTVHLIDAVTGKLLHSRVHAYGSEPVSAVVSENWVVYSYFNTKVKRTEVGSIALYEGSVGKKDLNGWSEPSCAPNCLSTRRSSLEESKAPIAMTQGFIFPDGIRALSTTTTLHGITNVDFLLALRSGKIMSMSKRLLDPRRPVDSKLSEADKREKLVQYHPHLPFMPQKVISYNLTVAGIREIVSGPTKLESTSMIFAYGVDLFFARITPSKAFDRLPDSFNTFAVGSLLIGLAIGVFVLRKLIAKKEVDAAWK